MRRSISASSRPFAFTFLFAFTCVFAFAFALLSLAACDAGRDGPRANVLMVSVDTLRADFVHAYGFGQANTPNIDALAARGALFENAFAAATLTAPAHASIMTSRWARHHSIGTRNGETRLEGAEVLADAFRGAGYVTAAFVSNVVLRRRSGLDRGFDFYDDELAEGEANRRAFFERRAEQTVRRALAWLGEPRDRPLFLWVHLQDPHGPYEPPEAYRGRLGEVPLRARHPLPVLSGNTGRAGIPAYQALEGVRKPALYAQRYAEEVMYADAWIGKLVSAFERRSAPHPTILLLTADHGESMGERGWFFQHGQATTPELAHVPLIVVAPGIEPGRHSDRVSQVDIAPTLLDLAGLDPLVESDGLSLRAYVESGQSLPDRFLFCDTKGESGAYTDEGFTRVGGSFLQPGAGGPFAAPEFDALTPNRDGLWRPAPIRDEARERLLEYVRGQAPLVAAGPMTPEHVEQLRALGYLDPKPGDPRAGQ